MDQLSEKKFATPLDTLNHFAEGSGEFVAHPAHARPGIKVFPDKLYVVCCLDNPLRFHNRYSNYWHFAHSVHEAGGILITVELATGDRGFEITEAGNPHHVQIRSRDEMFRKERLQNLGLERLPLGVKYVAVVDADVIFVRPDWCQEALHLLQHYDIIQMFTNYSDIGPDSRVMRTVPSFMWNFTHEMDNKPCDWSDGYYYDDWPTGKWSGAPGLAWAYRIEALDSLGSLLDRCILGGGDSHMAFGLAERWDLSGRHQEMHNTTDAYREYIQNWQRNAARIKRNIGYMDGSILHKWHGPKTKRGYANRYKILEENCYDPWTDLMTDHQGNFIFAGNKPKLRDDIRRYFRNRDEDSKELA